MNLRRRLAAVVVLAAFGSFTARAMDLHVHRDGGQAHQHAPAFHHHDVHVTPPVDGARLAGVDPDQTAMFVGMAAAHTGVTKPSPVCTGSITQLDQPRVGLPSFTGIEPRAHGPPSTVSTALRAPPILTTL